MKESTVYPESYEKGNMEYKIKIRRKIKCIKRVKTTNRRRMNEYTIVGNQARSR